MRCSVRRNRSQIVAIRPGSKEKNNDAVTSAYNHLINDCCDEKI